MKINFWSKLLGGLSGPRDIEIQLQLGKYLGMNISPKSNGPRRSILDWAFPIYCLIVFGYIMIFYTILEIIDAIGRIDSLGSTTENLCLTITHLSGIVKIINLTLKKDAFHGVIRMIRTMIDGYISNEEQKRAFNDMTITTLTVFFAFFTLVSSTALIGASSIIIGEKTIGTKFPYHVYVPHLLPHYIELFSFALAVTWNGLIIVVHDSLYISLMNHVCCQVEVLRISLQNIQIDRYPQPPIDEIKYCVKHHQLISTLRNRIEAIFSEMLLLQFLTSLLIFGMAGFQATVNNSIGNAQQITMYAYCCCILFELFVYCWFSNQVINQSQTIIFSGFSSSWYHYDRKYNMNLIILLMKAQQSIEMTAGGFFSISLGTFRTILTKAYSSIALLRQVYYGHK